MDSSQRGPWRMSMYFLHAMYDFTLTCDPPPPSGWTGFQRGKLLFNKWPSILLLPRFLLFYKNNNKKTFVKFLTRIGAKSNYTFHDLWSFEQGDLSFFPQPVLAVILLFPTFPDKVCWTFWNTVRNFFNWKIFFFKGVPKKIGTATNEF